jgi:transposase InsO family protein
MNVGRRLSKALITITAAVAAVVYWAGAEQAMADKHRRSPDRPPVWNELGPNERGFLEHHSDRWHTYPPSVRQRLRGQAQRLMEMDAEQLERLQQQRRAFQRLPPQRQQSLCQQFKRERGYLPKHCLSTR